MIDINYEVLFSLGEPVYLTVLIKFVRRLPMKLKVVDTIFELLKVLNRTLQTWQEGSSMMNRVCDLEISNSLFFLSTPNTLWNFVKVRVQNIS